MSDFDEKNSLIVKPEQSGKTFIAVEAIARNVGKHIEVIICDNNLLQTEQTAHRLKTYKGTGLKLYDGNGIKYAIFSSKSIKDRDIIVGKIFSGEIKCFVCCSNRTRINDICYIIKLFCEKSTDFKFRIWFDEADKRLPFVSELKRLIQKYENTNMVLLTATPHPLLKIFPEIPTYCIDNPTLPNYHGWTDNEIIHIEEKTSDIFLYIEYILSLEKDKIKPGQHWFIPGNMFCSSHNEIKDICISFGFSVIIINGNGIEISLPDGTTYFEKKDEMSEKLIPKLCTKYELNAYPIAITGYLCISRGITINSEAFLLTHGIIPYDMSDKIAECSQLCGRLKGNIKNFLNYKKPKVYCTNQIDNISTVMENLAIEIAKKGVFNKDSIPHEILNKTYLTKKKIDPRMNVPEIIPISKEDYISIEKAHGNVREICLRGMMQKYHSDFYQKIKNYEIVHTTISGKNKSENARKTIKTIRENAIKNKPYSAGITKENKEKNSCSIFIDKVDYALCIIYNTVEK